MARPKSVKDGKKLNLYLPSESIKALFRMATEQGQSMSSIVSGLIRGAKPKVKQP